jgi:hypothetical protein
MKKIILFTLFLILSGCSSEESDTISSSDFVYNLDSINLRISNLVNEKADMVTLNIDHFGSVLDSVNISQLSLSANDQLALIAPNGNIVLGKNYKETNMIGAFMACCEFNLPTKKVSLKAMQINNLWRMEFKRQGIVEDGFNIQFPAPLEIENSQALSVSPEQDFTIKINGTHSAGSLAVMIFSSCFDANAGISIELQETDDMITIPLNYTAGCEDPDANMDIHYEAKAKTNTTTDLLNAPIKGQARLMQYISLPLKIN